VNRLIRDRIFYFENETALRYNGGSPRNALHRFSFNWRLAFPLLVLFVFTAASLWSNLYAQAFVTMHDAPEMRETMRGTNLGWIWSAYNLVTIGTALLILLDVPKPDLNEWFDLRRMIKLNLNSAGVQTYWGVTTRISESGADIYLTQQLDLKSVSNFSTVFSRKVKTLEGKIPAQLEILEENICLSGNLSTVSIKEDSCTVRVEFSAITLEQERKLVALLFCRPGQWKRKNTPGELHSLWLLVKILLRPKVVFDRNPTINAIAVNQLSS
jgi:cellulose synthase (UDP-forming)